MSFHGGGWNVPPNPHFDANNWRPYPNQQTAWPAPGPVRGGGGWSNWLTDPYFARQANGQTQRFDYERNRMQLFHQPTLPYHRPTAAAPPPPRKPIMDTPMNEFVRQTLMNNIHVPGLRTGLQMRAAKKHDQNQQRIVAAKNKKTLKTLKCSVSVTSERLEVRWEPETENKDVKYVVNLKNVSSKTLSCVERPSTSTSAEVSLTAGELYRVTVECQCLSDGLLIANWSKDIRAEFAYQELKHLLQKCQHFISRGSSAEPQMHEFCVVYRCKPKVYWDEIHHYCNDVMQKYIKDENGQPGNLINGKINGLFFSARLLPDLTLPQCSPFGNVRMIIDAFELLNPDRHNFYFADFYCNKNIHYVTVVLCRIDSETDRYCREKLIKLNPFSNPFVKLVPPMDRFGRWRFFINYTLWVELYYTEDIQLNMGQFAAIVATGAGTSRIGGLPNNKNCTLCNLYPMGRKRLIDDDPHKDQSVRHGGAPPDDDSTMATILREDESVDESIADTLCYLVDRVEEQTMDAEQLASRIDPKVEEAVAKMNSSLAKTSREGALGAIVRNLSDFVAEFKKRRDALIRDVKKLKADPLQ